MEFLTQPTAASCMAAIELPWSTALVAVVLLLIMGYLMATALKAHGADGALKLWGGIGTFLSASLGGLFGVSIGESRGADRVEVAQAEVRHIQAKVGELGARLSLQVGENEKLQDSLHTAELAVLSARLPGTQRFGILPETYSFVTLDGAASEVSSEPLVLTKEPDSEWIDRINDLIRLKGIKVPEGFPNGHANDVRSPRKK